MVSPCYLVRVSTQGEYKSWLFAYPTYLSSTSKAFACWRLLNSSSLETGGRGRGLLPKLFGITFRHGGARLCNPVPLGCYFVPAISEKKPSGPDHLSGTVQPANWVAAAWMIEAVVARNEIAV